MKMGAIEELVFWSLLVVALVIAFKRLYFLYSLIRIGKSEGRVTHFFKRAWTTFVYVLAQKCNFKNISKSDLAGIGHLAIFWGAIVFVVNFIIFFFIGDAIGISESLRQSTFAHYFLYTSDIFGLLILLAMVWAVIRRCIVRPERLGPDFERGVFLTLTVGIFLLFLAYFSLEGLRFNLGFTPFQTPVASIFSDLYNMVLPAKQAQYTFFQVIWWCQYLIILGIIVYGPYSHHQHLLAAPFNIFFRSFRPSGAIEPVDFQKQKRFGAATIKDLTWKQLLEGFACTQCGRCQVNCPAYITQKPLSPKLLILDINKTLLNAGSKNRDTEFDDKLIKGIDSCTTCGACIDICPVFNRAMDVIIELRRNQVYEGKLDPGHQVALQRTFDYGNSYGVNWRSRDNILEILKIDKAQEGEKYDVLYWLGCSTYFDDRVQDTARAVVKILKKAGLKVAALGGEEKCCGDFVRRLGDEGLFQKLARENIEELKKVSFDVLLTHCPHGYNTLKNEYPSFGGTFSVMHHSEFLYHLIKEQKITLKKVTDSTIIYHDPCYLGRHNNIYAAPRMILKEISDKLLEFPSNRNRSLCCGAGGGHMWKHQEEGIRINEKRIEQAIEKKADIVAVACPFCLAMLEEAILMKGVGGKMRVKDLVELAENALR